MLSLPDKTLLYHGSYTEVREIDLSRCRPGKDFGRGFYLTTSLDQARKFSLLSARRHFEELQDKDKPTVGHVSTFEFQSLEGLEFHAFEAADEAWLHFVAGNRRAPLFPDWIAQFESADIVAGKIANDQTARTLQLYVTGAYGEPGTQQADAIAIATLLPNRLENQFCFRTQRSLNALRFVNCEAVNG